MASVESFGFHPKCKRTSTISLLFADDLLVFYKGDEVLVRHVQAQIHKFSEAYGLMANEEKSVVYFGVDNHTQEEITHILNMPLGEFPFRYLGVPLSHKTLTIIQFMPLVDRITQKIKHWICRALSFAACTY